MAFRINPISAEATRKALVENDRLDANHNEASSRRDALDAEELKDLERSLYYSATSSGAGTSPGSAAAKSPAPRRSLIDRLFRRG